MAFTYREHNGLTWSVSDALPVKHMFTGRLGGVGDFPYSSRYDPERLAWREIDIDAAQDRSAVLEVGHRAEVANAQDRPGHRRSTGSSARRSPSPSWLKAIPWANWSSSPAEPIMPQHVPWSRPACCGYSPACRATASPAGWSATRRCCTWVTIRR